MRTSLFGALAVSLLTHTLCYGQIAPQPTAPGNPSGQGKTQPTTPASPSTQGKITKVESDQITVQSNGKDMIFYTGPQTTYSLNGTSAKIGDFKLGADVNVVYTQQGDRMNATTIYTGAHPTIQPTTQPPANPGSTGVEHFTVKGKVLRLNGKDSVVVQGEGNKEIILWTNPESRILLKNRAAKFTDITTGAVVNVQYLKQGDRYFITTLEDGDVAASTSPAAGEEVSGAVVRVVGQDQIVVRTEAGKEITVYVGPQTTYQLGDQPGRFNDLREGNQLQIRVEVDGTRTRARSVIQRILNK